MTQTLAHYSQVIVKTSCCPETPIWQQGPRGLSRGLQLRKRALNKLEIPETVTYTMLVAALNNV